MRTPHSLYSLALNCWLLFAKPFIGRLVGLSTALHPAAVYSAVKSCCQLFGCELVRKVSVFSESWVSPTTWFHVPRRLTCTGQSWLRMQRGYVIIVVDPNNRNISSVSLAGSYEFTRRRWCPFLLLSITTSLYEYQIHTARRDSFVNLWPYLVLPLNSTAFQFAIRMRIDSFCKKNRPFDSLVVMQFLQ